MPRARSPNRDKAYKLWIDSNKTKLLKDIATELGISESQVRKWKNQDGWDKLKSNVTKQVKGNVTNRKGGQPGNKNAAGYGAPKGNLNPVKHGAYQNIYLHALPEDEKEMYERINPTVELDNEIKLIRLKIARLLNREKTFFYDMFGKKKVIDIKEEDREQGIVICINQLERLIKTKAAIINDTAKFEYQKQKDEIELEIKLARLELDKAKANMDDGAEVEDDGFLDALSVEVGNVWED